MDGGVESDSSDAGDEELLRLAMLPHADDSYREAPVQALEDSRASLNVSLASLGSSAPKDFSFLLQHHPVAADDGSCEEGCSPLNPDAPEFIPTLSHECPVVAFYESIPEHSTIPVSLGNLTEHSVASAELRPHRRRLGSSASSSDSVCAASPASHCSSFTRCSSNFQEFECWTPTKARMGSTPQSSSKVSGAGKRRRRAGTAGSKAPAMKRTKSLERRPDAKAIEMPEQTEEDWERRCATRQRAIAVGKASPEYIRYLEARDSGEGEPSGVKTPDPMDRDISKRQWKYIVQQWRNALKSLHGLAADGADTGSTASADEGLSIVTSVTDEADATSTTFGDDGSCL